LFNYDNILPFSDKGTVVMDTMIPWIPLVWH